MKGVDQAINQTVNQSVSQVAEGGREVAVKIFQRRMYKDEAEVARLREEITIALELSHPRLIQVWFML